MVDYIIALAVSFLSAYPGFGTFVLIVGGLRIAIKPIVSLLQEITNYTSYEGDNKVLNIVLDHPIYKGFVYLVDVISSLKLPKVLK